MRSNQATLQMFACMCCILSVLCDDIVLLYGITVVQRILFLLTHFFFTLSLPRVDYACIPQPSCEIPLQESLIPQEVSRGGSFFTSFHNVSKSFGTLPMGGGPGSNDDADRETKGEPQRIPVQRHNTADHRHNGANSQGSSAKYWLGEAVKVSVQRRGDGWSVCFDSDNMWRERERWIYLTYYYNMH